ncbi:MAG TPA: IS200/IS605 family transposase [Thermoanaerobaculia bacterium]
MPSTHSSLHCHVIFSTKDRRPFLETEIRDRVFEFLGGCLRHHDAQPLGIGGVADHVHLLFGFKPTHSISDLIRDVKKPSSEWIQSDLGIRKFSWQIGYGAFSVSKSAIPKVRRYITEQETHHQRHTFENEYVEFLERHGVEYNEKYLW